MQLYTELYTQKSTNLPFKTLTGSSNVSESWKETATKSKEDSSANAVKWRQSSGRCHAGTTALSRISRPDSANRFPLSCDLGGMSMNIQRKNSAQHFLMQSEREQTLVSLLKSGLVSITKKRKLALSPFEHQQEHTNVPRSKLLYL